jgi:hypothetical protein
MTTARLNDSWLTLNPAPQPGFDLTDGIITVLAPDPGKPATKARATVSLQGAAKGFELGQQHKWLESWVAKKPSPRSNAWSIQTGQPTIH